MKGAAGRETPRAEEKDENREQDAAERKRRKNANQVPDMGLEPMTSRLRVCHSAN